MTDTDIVDDDRFSRSPGGAGDRPNYGQPDHLTEKELLVIDAALYDEKFTETINEIRLARDAGDTTPVSLLDWANAWTPPDDPDDYNAHSTEEDWERLIATIKANPGIYDNVVLNNVDDCQERVSGGTMATFTYHDTTIIGFEGTHGDGREWPDNGQGGHWDETQTPVQEEALAYYQEMMTKYDPDNLIVTGHSKGGNLAMYVTVLAAMTGQPIGQVYNFDGQGFSDAFLMQYGHAIEALNQAGMIHTLAHQADYVHILLNGLDPDVTYYDSPMGTGTDILLNHSPFWMLKWDEMRGQYVMPKEGEQNELMNEAAGLLDYLHKFLPPTEYAIFCDLVTGLVDKSISFKDMLIDEAAREALGDDATISDYFKEPYGHLLGQVLPLIGAYGDTYGIGLPQLQSMIDTVMPGFSTVITNATDFLSISTGGLSSVSLIIAVQSALLDGSSVPYSAVVRDYSAAVLDQLMSITAAVETEPEWDTLHWDLWYRVENEFDDLDFPADATALTDYYHKMIDMKAVSRQRLIQIFADVRSEDRNFATILNNLADTLHLANKTLNEI